MSMSLIMEFRYRHEKKCNFTH